MPACRSAKDSISVSGGGDWAERALHGARALLACRDVQQRAWFADHTRQAWLRVEPAGLTLDGSGTGCCSLLQLRHCPIGVLQIDRAFVHQLTSTPLPMRSTARASCSRAAATRKGSPRA